MLPAGLAIPYQICHPLFLLTALWITILRCVCPGAVCLLGHQKGLFSWVILPESTKSIKG